VPPQLVAFVISRSHKGPVTQGARYRNGRFRTCGEQFVAIRCTLVCVRGYVGVTDNEWYRFLASRPEITLVNFWRPGSGKEFRALAEGEYFFFKTHKPHDQLVGGGYYSGFAAAPVSEAWHLFGEANGVASLEQMRARIAHYRRSPIGPGEDPEIGCIFIRDVAFFPESVAISAPPGFASNIVQGKTYDTAAPAVAQYFADVTRLLTAESVDVDFGETWHHEGEVFGKPRLTPQRLAQHAFKEVLLTAYHGRCSITGSKIRPALQGAHIRPVAAGGRNRLDNGLLLRADVHAMFDGGYLGVDPSFRLRVSPRLRNEFGNGEQFYAKEGEVITLPDRKGDRKSSQIL
jgi:putative restriction endonuclease